MPKNGRRARVFTIRRGTIPAGGKRGQEYGRKKHYQAGFRRFFWVKWDDFRFLDGYTKIVFEINAKNRLFFSFNRRFWDGFFLQARFYCDLQMPLFQPMLRGNIRKAR